MTQENDRDISLQALTDIRSIMDRSTRFLSLSGMSGIWAGSVALAGAFIAKGWYDAMPVEITAVVYNSIVTRMLLLSVAVFITALIGGIYFTWRKAKAQNATLWNMASRRMMWQLAIPLVVGCVFVLNFIYNGNEHYVVPACLAFYGLALINGSKYTLTDIQYLGILELILACISLIFPVWDLYFWALGFGVLHILYGIIMWNKYDRNVKTEQHT